MRKLLSHNSSHGVELYVDPEPRNILVAPACNHAICYRPLTSVTLTFVDKRSGNVTEFTTSVPDPHQIAGVDIERSSFVKRDTVLTFVDGTLTTVNVTKPSEVAAAALLPLSIVTAIFEGTNSAITGLLGVKNNEIDAQTELVKAQTELLTELKAYRDAEAAVLPEVREEDGGALTGAKANTVKLDVVTDEQNNPEGEEL